MNESENLKFDKFCQKIMAFILIRFHKSMAANKLSAERSFWYNIYTDIKGRFITDVIKVLPMYMRDHTAIYLLIEMLVDIFSTWLRKLIEEKSCGQMTNTNDEGIKESHQNREVNGFFGYAIHSIMGKLLKDFHRGDNYEDEEKQCGSQETLVFVKSLRILHQDALNDSEYIYMGYYAPTNMMINLGGLTLVSAPYFTFAKTLMSRIRKLVSNDRISNLKNDCYATAKREILNDSKLQELFMEVSKEYLDDNVKEIKYLKLDGILIIYKGLLKKTLNVRYKESQMQFKQRMTSRYTKTGSDVSFRSELKVRAKTGDLDAADGIMRSVKGTDGNTK